MVDLKAWFNLHRARPLKPGTITMLLAVKQAWFEEMSVVENVRRNPTGAEILRAVENIPKRKNENGLGRKAKQLAERLGVSQATIYQAKAILKNADEKDIKAVRNGEMSIKRVYMKMTGAMNESKAILKRAVILLAGEREESAAQILVNGFLPEESEREQFVNQLPEEVKTGLALLVEP